MVKKKTISIREASKKRGGWCRKLFTMPLIQAEEKSKRFAKDEMIHSGQTAGRGESKTTDQRRVTTHWFKTRKSDGGETRTNVWYHGRKEFYMETEEKMRNDVSVCMGALLGTK